EDRAELAQELGPHDIVRAMERECSPQPGSALGELPAGPPEPTERLRKARANLVACVERPLERDAEIRLLSSDHQDAIRARRERVRRKAKEYFRVLAGRAVSLAGFDQPVGGVLGNG